MTSGGGGGEASERDLYLERVTLNANFEIESEVRYYYSDLATLEANETNGVPVAEPVDWDRKVTITHNLNASGFETSSVSKVEDDA